MKGILKHTYQSLLKLPGLVIPAFVSRRVDTERYSIDKFVREVAAPSVKPGALILDAGAGRMQFKPLFAQARYESTDFADVFHKDVKDRHTFVCSLDDIPKPDNTYDAVLNTQVLEHVEHPQRVINELYRVLKPGGKLFLTTNQMFPVHHAPYNFFFYTNFGLASLFKNAGFKIDSIEARGGVFWLLSKVLMILPSYVFYQVAYDGYKKHAGFRPSIRRTPLIILFLPLFLFFQILFSIICIIFFYLDVVDRQKQFTLGYSCVCTKPSD